MKKKRRIAVMMLVFAMVFLSFAESFAEGDVAEPASDGEAAETQQVEEPDMVQESLQDADAEVPQVTDVEGLNDPDVIVVDADIQQEVSASAVPMGAPTRGDPKKVDVKITDFKIKNKDGTMPDGSFAPEQDIRLDISWDATDLGNTIVAGDYFDVTFPDTLIFPTEGPATSFNLYDPEDPSIIIATGKINSNGAAGGGTVRVTFTDKVEDKYNVKGNMYLTSKFNLEKINQGEDNTFSVSIDSSVVEDTVSIGEIPGMGNETITKWGGDLDDPVRVKWTLRINGRKGTYDNVVIKDTLTAVDGDLDGVEIIEGTFILREVEMNSQGGIIREISKVNISADVRINDTKTGFEYTLGDINGQQYLLQYETTFKKGLEVKNKAFFESTQTNDSVEILYMRAESGGEGGGDLVNKIKIVKVDSEDNSIVLPGAVFKIKRVSDGTEIELTTDEKGEAVSDKLVAGEYTIEEITPPAGYIKNDEILTVSVKDGEVLLRTITNEKVKINIPVEKRWIGPSDDGVNVVLLADGEEVARVYLKLASDWKHTFTDLPKYKADGTEISYTVKEILIEGFDVTITGNAAEGFVITNYNTMKTEIPVEKVWEGAAADSVTVRLLADGLQKEEATLNAEGNWKHTFTDLPVYDPETGEEIVYTIEEVEIKGYTSAISGSASDGFTVTNTKDKLPVKEKSPSEPKTGTVKTPKTGDSAPMASVILLLVVSGALWIGLRRKAQKQ